MRLKNRTGVFYFQGPSIYVSKIEQVCSNSRNLVYASQKIEQACSISRNLVYVSQKIEQACSILNIFQKCSYRHSIDKKYHL